MPMADDNDLHAFLATLTYRKDIREPPDDGHRTQFGIGWKKAIGGPTISEKTLLDRLTWANLGYRAGKAFGPASNAKIYTTFDRFAAIYKRHRA
jgi:hypothetical protein